MTGLQKIMVGLVAALCCLDPVFAQEGDWPRTVELEQGSVTIYEPQVDEMDDDYIRFRAALAWRESPSAEPVFGAGWFESEAVTNNFSRTVHPVTMTVTDTRFPEGTPDLQGGLSTALAEAASAGNFRFSLDDLEASREVTEAENLAARKLSTAPPKIIYRDHPALLVTLDGKPVLREIENSPLEAVINTPYPLIHDGRRYWLNVAEGVWYRAAAATGPYSYASDVPKDVAAAVKIEDEDGNAPPASPDSADTITAADAPEIVVTTVPAELIVTDGPAAFVPLVDDLLVLQNSDDDVFMHVSGQEYYIVLSGRWYRASSLAGPWKYHSADDLPAAFASIPLESDQADSRVYVAGTQEAKEAVLDAQVPQTAVVERGEVDIDVQYDGQPQYAAVDGTDMTYVQNTGSTVILSNGLYYLVEDGVWYVSNSHSGPWQVSTSRPDQVRVIQPSSPVYHTKYVYVYDYTPSVVYVGYTPGYTGSYVYHNTVFYGSGWYYRPWVSPYYYYPYHSTWGFHVSYNSWSGWGFGLSWGWGPFYVNYNHWYGGYWHHRHHWHHHHHHRYWGPHGYRPRHGHYAHRRPGHGGHRPAPYQRHHNLYRDERQHASVRNTRDVAPRSRGSIPSQGRMEKYAGGEDKYGSGRGPKSKGMYSKPVPVSRSELSGKASRNKQDYSATKVRKMADGKSNKSGKYAGKSLKSPVQKLNSETVADLGKLRVKNTADKHSGYTKGGKDTVSRPPRNSSARTKILASNTQQAIAKVPSRANKYDTVAKAGKTGKPVTANRSGSAGKASVSTQLRQSKYSSQQTAPKLKPVAAPKYSYKSSAKSQSAPVQKQSQVQRSYQPAPVQKQSHQMRSYKPAAPKRSYASPQQKSGQKNTPPGKNTPHKSTGKQKS